MFQFAAHIGQPTFMLLEAARTFDKTGFRTELPGPFHPILTDWSNFWTTYDKFFGGPESRTYPRSLLSGPFK